MPTGLGSLVRQNNPKWGIVGTVNEVHEEKKAVALVGYTLVATKIVAKLILDECALIFARL